MYLQLESVEAIADNVRRASFKQRRLVPRERSGARAYIRNIDLLVRLCRDFARVRKLLEIRQVPVFPGFSHAYLGDLGQVAQVDRSFFVSLHKNLG